MTAGGEAAALVLNRRPQREPFRHAVPLGTSCYPAWLLRTLGLRRAAYPFDWLFANPAMVVDMLADRFALFLDPAQHERVVEPADDPQPPRCHHRAYRARFGVDQVFNHHDVTRPDVLAGFRRAADRLLAVTAGPDKVLLLMVNTAGGLDAAAFDRLCAAVDGLGPRNTLLALDVARSGDTLDMGMVGPHQRGRHRLRTYRSTSDIHGVAFANRLDDLVLQATVTQFRFDLPPVANPAPSA